MPRNGECIYTIYPDGHVQSFSMRNSSQFCKDIVKFGNWYESRAEAEIVSEHLKRMFAIRKNKQKKIIKTDEYREKKEEVMQAILVAINEDKEGELDQDYNILTAANRIMELFMSELNAKEKVE